MIKTQDPSSKPQKPSPKVKILFSHYINELSSVLFFELY